MSHSRSRTLALALVLAGCPGDAAERARDKDGDGFMAVQADGDDCNDEDPAIHPGADEICGDSEDNDCDTLVDEDGVGAETFYPDVDGDGFGGEPAVQACTPPIDHVQVAGDCDDAEAGTNPDATEQYYDGIDQDCDGADDYDQDGDGFSSEAELEGGDDCDDTRMTVNPDAEEVCGNLLDDDCDGTPNDCAWSTWAAADTARLLHAAGETPSVTLGDVDGDGASELLGFAPDSGDFYLHYWPLGTDLETGARVHLDLDPQGTTPPEYDYVASVQQDLSGDGRADLVVGAWTSGTRGWIKVIKELHSAQPAQLDEAAVWRTYDGPAEAVAQGFGSAIVPLGAAGASHGAVAVPFEDELGASVCLVFHDAPSSGIGDVAATLEIQQCGAVVRGATQSDGLSSIVVRQGNGSTYRLIDPTPADTVDATAAPEAALWALDVDATPLRNTPDLDGDGDTEVLALDDDDPVLHLTEGPITSDTPPALQRSSITAGAGIVDFLDAHTGDFNGDGALDLVLLADTDEGDGQLAGTALLVRFGPFASFNVTLDPLGFDAALTLPDDEPALSLHPADLDGDGYTDLALPGPGGLHVVRGQGR